ncbi:AraC family transcriptional regulator [Paraburkholderia phymatum]|uniref:Transcriptional regulator, AraC family n=1 Tax=Paraburkholderia phymatum (strain DSM 17167 / CIP 108236 / LMG 21445 / STM815) TaxID=391038 RepID=B2JUK1_PARP8|nr:AraC family transcriptional regulator [Paraburkholderia phymatum]ACC76172.1 transcriptional regulator, AraC family [Paraburkholderia phymatum STM815]
MDAVSDVLRVVRLGGAVYLHAELTAPWSLIGHADQALCTAYLPRSDRIVSYHLITEGSCWARLPDSTDPAIRVSAGELLVVPQGEAHIMGSAVNIPPVPAGPLLESQLATMPGEVLNLSHGGGGAPTRILCGFLACDDALSNPVLGSLPRLFKVNVRNDPQSAWIEASLRYAAEEAAQRRAGSAIVLSRLSELLFVWAVRRCIDELPDDRKNWLAGVKDRFVGRALSILHAQPAYGWTVDELARKVGLSRSAFAQRFTDLLGQPPMQYLARWRLIVAAQELSYSSKAIAAIAEEVGYESESAFHRAFRREFGQPPAAWRKRHSHVTGAEALAASQ